MFGVAINCVAVKLAMQIDQPPNSLPGLAYPAMAFTIAFFNYIWVRPLVLSLNRDRNHD